MRSKVTNGRIVGQKGGATVNGDAEESEVRKTDYSRWRLLAERGRQRWRYLEDDDVAKNWPQTTADKYHLGLPTVRDIFLPSHNTFWRFRSKTNPSDLSMR